MSQQGWISLHRKITECEIWLSNEPFSVRDAWIDILLMANHETKTIVWGGKAIEVHPGERITSQAHLAERWHWGRQKVRDYLELLKNLKMISIKSTNRYSVIKVLKYEVYQNQVIDLEPTDNHQITNKEPSSNHQITTNNNDNNDNNDNKILSSSSSNNKHISKGTDYNLFQDIERCLMMPITPFLAEQFKALEDEVGSVIVHEALEESAKYGARSYSYVEAVARNMASGGKSKKGNPGTIDFDAARERIRKEMESNGNRQA